MAQLTLEIPDELASRLEPLRDRLPELLVQFLEIAPSTSSKDLTSEVPEVYTEVLDFLLQRPTPMEIIDFKVSPPIQGRLQVLLSKNREAALTSEEVAELDVYEQLEHLMILLKTRALDSLN